MLELLDNKESFRRVKPNKHIFLIVILLVVIIGFIIIIIKVQVSDNYQTKGYVDCTDKCVIKTAIPSYVSYEKLSINKKFKNFHILDKELKIDEEHFTSYYEITIELEDVLNDKEIVELNFYYNKQRIIEKIKDYMF
ncbi:MAG: hypothetical protein HFI36_01665 [Bacilli bacterium]|jgi:hypothetical protein|nr:hypothetical protein [Bacilli bacterium]